MEYHFRVPGRISLGEEFAAFLRQPTLVLAG